MSTPTLSVIIPTYNRRERLMKMLEALRSQSLPRADFEVYVVSDGSTDDTAAAVKSFQANFTLNLIEQKNSGPSAARNNGARKAAGEVLLFLDDDIEPSVQLVEIHLAAQAMDEKLVLIGPQSRPIGERCDLWIEWEHRMLENQYRQFESGVWEAGPNNLYSGNFSVHRDLFFEAGGFDERFIRQEDVELGYRLAAKGAHFRFEPKAAAIHRPTRTLESWYRTPYLYGIRDVQMVRDKGVDQIMELAQRHFRQRNWITRALAHLVIGTPFLENAILGLGKSGIRAFNRFGPRRLGLMLCSFVFNLRYLQGMSEEMGGRTELWRAIGRKTNDIKSEALL